MKYRTIAFLSTFLLTAFLGQAVPLWGGTVYVPLVAEQTVGENRVTSEVRVTNNSTSARELTYIFLPIRSDGTLPDREAGKVTVRLDPRQSEVLTDFLMPGEQGLLEIIADPEVSVTSRLLSVPADGRLRPGLEIPVLTSENLQPAGGTAVLQGWRRDRGHVTDFYLFNLGHEAAVCEVQVYKRRGALIADQSIPLQPLSLQLFEDVLSILGEARRNEVSATVSCDQRFHTFAVTIDRETAEMAYLSPAGTGSSELRPPGDPEPPPPPPPTFDCPDGALFEKAGAFHRPRPGREDRRFEMPTVGGQIFQRLTVDVDFTPADWNQRADGNHAVFWLNRTERWASNVFGYVNVFGPNKNFAKISTNAGFEPGAQLRAFKGDAVFEKGVTYHVHYVYDTSIRLMEAVFTVHTGTPDEEEVVRVTGTTTVGEIRTQEPGFFIYFGHPTGTVGPEVPTYDWLYSNLCVQLE